jgi:molybdenum cofactor biosynthesis enzyme MoaA
LVRELSFHGLTVGINSNLATVCKEDAYFLKKMGVSSVLTSLMSYDFKVNNEITQRSDSFEKTVRGIKILKEIGVPVAVNMVLLVMCLRMV